MNKEIKSVNIFFDDGNSIFIESNLFSNFYIANIDSEANEVPYEKMFNTNTLYANFFTLKISSLINEYYHDNVIKNILNSKNISEVVLCTNLGKKIKFQVASQADPFKKNSDNYYDNSFLIEDDLCILITEYNIKHKKHLFV